MNKQKKNNLIIKKQKTKRKNKRAQERWENEVWGFNPSFFCWRANQSMNRKKYHDFSLVISRKNIVKLIIANINRLA